ncbi:MAG: peptidyl-prolyl cis-trans isomerase [Solirubrobacteraceae bacterium]
MVVVVVATGSGGVPSNAVATVGSATLSKAQFNHWLTVEYDTQSAQVGTPPPLPVPPHYTACVAYYRTLAASESVKATTSEFKANCASQYSQLKQQVMELLLVSVWIQGEANDRGLHVTSAQVAKQVKTTIAAQFPTPGEFTQHLIRVGETTQDFRYGVLVSLLGNKVVASVTKQAGSVSAAAIARYYKSNYSLFTVPARRNIEVVLVGSAATAATVKSLLAGGESYATVAKQYSTDPSTKDNGGVADGVQASEETPLLAAAIFKAPVDVLEGPVKTPFGYYVFTVTKSVAGSVESLKQATPEIRSVVKNAQQTAAVKALNAAFLKKWRARTQCAAAYMIVQACGNAPATSATGASGTTATGAT